MNIDKADDDHTTVGKVADGHIKVWKGRKMSTEEIREAAQKVAAEADDKINEITSWPYPMNPRSYSAQEVADMQKTIVDMRKVADEHHVRLVTPKAMTPLKDIDSYTAMNPEAKDDEDISNQLSVKASAFSKQLERIKGRMLQKMVMVYGLNHLRDYQQKAMTPLKDIDFEGAETYEAIKYSKAITEHADNVWMWSADSEAKTEVPGRRYGLNHLRDYQQKAVDAIKAMGPSVTVAIDRRYETFQKPIAEALEAQGYNVVGLDEIGAPAPSLDLSNLERRAQDWAVKARLFTYRPDHGFKKVRSASARKRKRARDRHRLIIVFMHSGVVTERWSAAHPQHSSIPKSDLWLQGTTTGRLSSEGEHISQSPRQDSSTGRLNREGPAEYHFVKDGIVRFPRD